jgi:acetoin utilization deacetylase AcuC-like enzyme
MSGFRTRLGDEAYLSRLSEALDMLGEIPVPDIVFYNAGVDPHDDDRLGRLSLSDDRPAGARQNGDRAFPAKAAFRSAA